MHCSIETVFIGLERQSSTREKNILFRHHMPHGPSFFCCLLSHIGMIVVFDARRTSTEDLLSLWLLSIGESYAYY
ncbi:uncharacterized protein BO96DRAFT_111909 [Aspergillus niger CBS 101883]|uniref:Uncharacterized protein n=1 Tax=Aspergillus niger ATCC 13496 TaxID=1353008 RepID=A0A370C3K6_ASPNG|nr:uncharacterized protein BO96DRAFT_111909 [Aspergillus niger CBS 101883]PYH54251.1 hypothetical protein BO96DRAFT_111909 [Aspergillus niger CBS 101883]RDH22484.1 hypothetical protein M747DRAFT_179164 [Aspergillus niger ATCC 13496]